MNIRRLILSLSLGTTLALGGAYAAAQTLPNAQPVVQQPQRTPIAFTQTSLQGAVSRFVLGPMGRVHAVVLDSGKVVMLGHHGDRAAQSLGVGARIQVSGYSSAQAPNTILGATIRDASGNVLVQPNPRMIQRLTQPGGMQGHHGGHGRGMHRRHAMQGPQGAQGPQGQGHGRRFAMQQRLAQLPQRNATGTVSTVIVGPRGNIRGAVLQDGTSVMFNRQLARAATQQQLAAGQRVTIQGRGDQYARGVALVAERVTFANGTTVAAQ
ncbi:MAG: hypothetical protein JNK05_28355 [Myxococcales bacterium]|nr:hypothetical protein [Myxococcales bacterium]